MDTGAAICFDLQKCISPPAGVRLCVQAWKQVVALSFITGVLIGSSLAWRAYLFPTNEVSAQML